MFLINDRGSNILTAVQSTNLETQDEATSAVFRQTTILFMSVFRIMTRFWNFSSHPSPGFEFDSWLAKSCRKYICLCVTQPVIQKATRKWLLSVYGM